MGRTLYKVFRLHEKDILMKRGDAARNKTISKPTSIQTATISILVSTQLASCCENGLGI